MQVTRKQVEPKFEPVVITLESAYEIQALVKILGQFPCTLPYSDMSVKLYSQLKTILDTL